MRDYYRILTALPQVSLVRRGVGALKCQPAQSSKRTNLRGFLDRVVWHRLTGFAASFAFLSVMGDDEQLLQSVLTETVSVCAGLAVAQDRKHNRINLR